MRRLMIGVAAILLAIAGRTECYGVTIVDFDDLAPNTILTGPGYKGLGK